MFCRFGSFDVKRPVAATAWWARIDVFGELVGVRRAQLGERTVVEHQTRQFVLVGERLERFLVRRWLTARRLERDRQFQLFIQQLLQLFR